MEAVNRGFAGGESYRETAERLLAVIRGDAVQS
jgi:hypothetical protein